MADCDVVVGVVVGVVVTVVVGVEEDAPDEDVEAVPDEGVEPVPDEVDAGELAVVAAVAVVPGISLETTIPSVAAAAVARMATPRDKRRTRAPAISRRAGPGPAWRRAGPVGKPGIDCLGGEGFMDGMSPCEPRGPRTAG
ncbi:MAG: hypothetical protein P4L20_00855 [Acidimicrobiales bacterium]|nr:hypothetical protein [Acidimicrobiales bacterium]